MDTRTSGAWLIHHTNKLDRVNSNDFFWDVEQAGKCGKLLSAISQDNDFLISDEKLKTLANFAGIKRSELDTILKILKRERLINTDSRGNTMVLGITQTSVLTNTNSIFQSIESAKPFGDASILIAEKTSHVPANETLLKEEVSDEYKIASDEVDNLFEYVKACGLVDFEDYGDRKMLFNGNLFNRESIDKSDKILSGLSPEDQRAVNELNEVIESEGCALYDRAVAILGKVLYQKLASFNFFAVNTISNEFGNTRYITKPSAFIKFGDSFVADTFDYAKALVCSLKFGMEQSPEKRGSIKNYEALIRKMVNGSPVGPTPAIGQDYKYLQLKNVVDVKLQPGSKTHYYMWLRKKEVGEMALEVLKHGQSMEKAVLQPMNRKKAQNYISPEQNRANTRVEVVQKVQSGRTEYDIRNLVNSLTD